MKDPELLKLITEVAQEQDSATKSRDAESWDLYAQGKLDDAAFEKLMADTTDEDPELLKELYRPIDDERVDAMVDAVLAELPAEEAQSIQESPVETPKSSVWEIFKLWQLVPVGAAAVILFALIPSALPPPVFQLEVAGQNAQIRGEAGKTMKFAVGNTMVLTLRPESPVETDVFAAALLQLESGRTHAIDARVEVSSTGAIQLTWTVDISDIDERATGLVVAVSTEANMLTKSLRAQKKSEKVSVFERPLEISSAP